MRLVALDLVRLFAAFSVVMYHYTARHDSNTFPGLSQITKFGYLGVPLFFIISGYVITLSANNRTALEFAISRFTRLYPTYWVGILFTATILLVFGYHSISAQQLLANLTMLNDYFGYQNVDGVYWTLQAELKFYACIFLLIVIGQFDKIRAWLTAWLLLTALHLATGQPFFMGWFITPHYSSFFIAGVAFYLIHKEGVNFFNLFVLLSSAIISCFRGFEQAGSFIQHAVFRDKIIAILLTLAFFILFYFLVTKIITLQKRKIYLILGGLTYPLYLIHNMAGKALIDNLKGNMNEEYAVIVILALMLCFSYITYLIVDRKFSERLKIILFSLFQPRGLAESKE